jgi:hypothetical protein
MSTFCPVCMGQGIVQKARTKTTREVVYVCYECDALWPEGVEVTEETSTDASGFCASRGLPGSWWSEIEKVEEGEENQEHR